MFQKLLISLFLIFTINSFAQDSKFSVELNYPIPVDKNFVGQNYNGIIDLGLKYRFLDLDLFNIGASVNGGLLKTAKNGMLNQRDVNAYTIQPRVFAELDIAAVKSLHPSIGLGYSFMIFSGTTIVGDRPGEVYSTNVTMTEGGFNLNLGLAYDITTRFFGQIQYDFIMLGTKDGIPKIKYNTNVNILKVGLGYRF